MESAEATALRARRRILVAALGVESGLLAAALLIGRLVHVDPLATWAATPRTIALGGLAALPPLAALGAILRSGHPVWRRLVRAVDAAARPLVSGLEVWHVVTLSALAGVAEEALFRGLLQAGLAPVIGPAAALLLAAAVFGAAHLVTASYGLVAAVMGLYLGWSFDASGTLAVPAVAHALYDAVALLVFRRRVGGAGRVEEPGR